MSLQHPPAIGNQWSVELETARALFASGYYDEALKVVLPIPDRPGVDNVARFAALLLRACVESQRDQFSECLDTLKTAGPLVDAMPPDLRGKFFGQRALAHRNLNQVSAAYIDYEAARYCAEESGDEQTEASVRNNLAKVYCDAGRVGDALLEVDAAIKTATRLGDEINLGRYLDSKAQILVENKRYAEALSYSKRAISLLADHPAGLEARFTHGLAMVGSGSAYMNQPATVEQFRAKHDAAKLVQVALNIDVVRLALKRTGGHVLKAADLLHIRHSALIRFIDEHQLDRAPKRRRAKALPVK